MDGVRAVGVQWHQWGDAVNSRTTYVRGEVLLAAGTINSPKILMTSGIGDPEHLKNVGVRNLGK